MEFLLPQIKLESYANEISEETPAVDGTSTSSSSSSEELSNDNNKNKLEDKSTHSKKNTKYGTGDEAKAIQDDLNGFDISKSKAYYKLIEYFGKSLRLNEIIGIISSIQYYLKFQSHSVLPKISRNSKRSFSLMVKYVDDNFDKISPVLPYVKLCNSQLTPIPIIPFQ